MGRETRVKDIEDIYSALNFGGKKNNTTLINKCKNRNMLQGPIFQGNEIMQKKKRLREGGGRRDIGRKTCVCTGRRTGQGHREGPTS